MNVARSYFRRVDDIKYCVITGIHGDKTSHFLWYSQNSCSEVSCTTQWDVTDVVSNTVRAPCIYSSAIRPVTFRGSGAGGHIQIITSYVQSLREVSLTVSSDPLDVFESILKRQNQLDVDQFCEEIKSVVSSPVEIDKHKFKLSSHLRRTMVSRIPK